ncbi:MAG: hypothetical protein ABJO02_17975 [Reichenbachiella sp.]|uniref:hypothetical protein n=1 Tax=Reichenbachiella sp. TaxID=2184521 RepID=UPI002966F61B|nr:hypothetical protein [Reichenbachiella sp.]MDW3211446.1 hypothetical protein [Reichenbachiella sp.]
MHRKKFTDTAINSLIIVMMISFVISDVFPDYSLEQQTVNMEEADLDGEESSEEKKESSEQKEKFQQDISHAHGLIFEAQDKRGHLSNDLLLQELCLPVITPPPDRLI